MLRIIESKKPFTELARDLEKAVPNHKFGVLGVHDLKAKMAEKGVAFAPECRETNLEISTALPCRISVYEERGRAKLATIMPTALVELYGTPALRRVAEEDYARCHHEGSGGLGG